MRQHITIGPIVMGYRTSWRKRYGMKKSAAASGISGVMSRPATGGPATGGPAIGGPATGGPGPHPRGRVAVPGEPQVARQLLGVEADFRRVDGAKDFRRKAPGKRREAPGVRRGLPTLASEDQAGARKTVAAWTRAHREELVQDIRSERNAADRALLKLASVRAADGRAEITAPVFGNREAHNKLVAWAPTVVKAVVAGC